MDVAQASELINKTSVNRDGSEMISLFNGHEKRSKCGLATNLHRIIAASLLCFNKRLKPLLPHPRSEMLSPVQDCDPYLKGLLIALYGCWPGPRERDD
jgi:hypothetical protein